MANVAKLLKQAHSLLKRTAAEQMELAEAQALLATTVGKELDPKPPHYVTENIDTKSKIVANIAALMKEGTSFAGNILIDTAKNVKFYSDAQDAGTVAIVNMLNKTWAPVCKNLLARSPKVPLANLDWKNWMKLDM